MREACKLHRRRRPVGTARKGDTEDFGGRYGVFAESLVKVTHTEKQHRIGVLLFHLEILFHQRGLDDLLCHN